jgi:hypothetical protein
MGEVYLTRRASMSCDAIAARKAPTIVARGSI